MSPLDQDDTEPLSLAADEHIDELCLRFEQGWKIGRPTALEEMLRGVADDMREPLLRELLQVEVHHRRLRGENPVAQEYVARFPGMAALVRSLLPATLSSCRTHPLTKHRNGQRIRWEGENRPDAASGPALPRIPGYEVLEKIGGGGMGVVYRARQVKLNRLVALKMILAGGHAGDTQLERFRSEAEAIARVRHPGIVEVHDYGVHEGQPFFALELCQGGNLSEHLAGTPLPGREAARIVAQLSRAVQAAHDANVVHRDLKPANVLLVSGRVVSGEWSEGTTRGSTTHHSPLTTHHSPTEPLTLKITDFGLAKRMDAGSGLTHTDQVLGTPSYMAPEQAQGTKDVGPAADIYALGAILYECLTGRPPFRAATPVDTIRQVIDDEPLSPSRLQPKVPRDVETICLKCLAKEPGKRYGSARELADDLERYLADQPIHARRSSALERARRWCRRNPMVATLSAAVLLLLTLTAVGGVAMSLRLGKALGIAQEAEHEGKRKLFASYVSEADAIRMSRRPGQRFGSLRRIRDALEVAREVGLSDEDRVRLRSIAIAALCLPDMEPGQKSEAASGEPLSADRDPVLRKFLIMDEALRRVPPPVHVLNGHSWFSVDGRFMAVGTSEQIGSMIPSVRVWRIDGVKPVKVLEERQAVCEEAVAFRPNGRHVAFGHADGSVSLQDLTTGKRIGNLKPGPGPVKCLVYHPRLPRLAVACGNEVAFWDLDKQQRLVHVPHPQVVTAIAWHPRGHRLATVCADKLIRLWEAETARAVTLPWAGHKVDGIRLTFNHAGDRVVSNDWDRIARLWDSATGELLLSYPSPSFPHFSSDDRMILRHYNGGKSDVIRVAGGQELRTLRRSTPGGHESIRLAAMHPRERILVVNTTTGIGFFDPGNGEEVGFIAGRFDYHIDFDKAGATWTVGENGLLRWPVRPDRGFPSLLRIGPPERITDLGKNGQDGFAISDDGRVVAMPSGIEAVVVHRGPPRRTLRLGPLYDVRQVFLSPDGHVVVTKSHFIDKTGIRYKVWDADTGRLLANLPYSGADPEETRFSPDSRYFYVRGSQLRRLDLVSLMKAPHREPLPSADESAYPREEVGRTEQLWFQSTFSPDGRLAVISSDVESIRLLDVEKNKDIARLQCPERARIQSADFSADGMLVVHGRDTGALYIFDLRRIRKQLAELGLDWDLPPYPAARPEETNPTLAPPLQVKLIHAEAASRVP